MEVNQSSSLDDRPSFSSFWKTKEETAGKSLTFVQSDPSQASKQAPAAEGTGPTEEQQRQKSAARDKRRAQVRSAQVQHRARKADYVRQLESDIEGIRERIEGAERERRSLRAANQAYRAQLLAGGGGGADGGACGDAAGAMMVVAGSSHHYFQQDGQYHYDGQQQHHHHHHPGFYTISSGDDALFQQAQGFGGVGGIDNSAFDCFGDGSNLEYFSSSAGDASGLVIDGLFLNGGGGGMPGPSAHYYDPGSPQQQFVGSHSSSSSSGSSPYSILLPDMNDNSNASAASSSSYSAHGDHAAQGQVMMKFLFP